jgi:hypothetical protein
MASGSARLQRYFSIAKKYLAQESSATTLLTVKFRQPTHEFTFGVGMSFISYPLVLTPLI